MLKMEEPESEEAIKEKAIEEETKRAGNNFYLVYNINRTYFNGIFRKNNPAIINPIPMYWFGSLNLSPSTI